MSSLEFAFFVILYDVYVHFWNLCDSANCGVELLLKLRLKKFLTHTLLMRLEEPVEHWEIEQLSERGLTRKKKSACVEELSHPENMGQNNETSVSWL